MMQICCSTHSVILNAMATQYPCSLNGVYSPHWLAQWSCHCHAHCSPLSLAVRLYWHCTNCPQYVNNGRTFSRQTMKNLGCFYRISSFYVSLIGWTKREIFFVVEEGEWVRTIVISHSSLSLSALHGPICLWCLPCKQQKDEEKSLPENPGPCSGKPFSHMCLHLNREKPLHSGEFDFTFVCLSQGWTAVPMYSCAIIHFPLFLLLGAHMPILLLITICMNSLSKHR